MTNTTQVSNESLLEKIKYRGFLVKDGLMDVQLISRTAAFVSVGVGLAQGFYQVAEIIYSRKKEEIESENRG